VDNRQVTCLRPRQWLRLHLEFSMICSHAKSKPTHNKASSASTAIFLPNEHCIIPRNLDLLIGSSVDCCCLSAPASGTGPRCPLQLQHPFTVPFVVALRHGRACRIFHASQTTTTLSECGCGCNKLLLPSHHSPISLLDTPHLLLEHPFNHQTLNYYDAHSYWYNATESISPTSAHMVL
jgi:hypothetical protein